MNRLTKIKITELNPHVICVLCGGYYINATTIVECLHSFCRTCITRYLETSKYCPVCDVMVHKTRPLEYIRSDKTLQDLVYKLVPGLYKSEMKRRREYYAEHDDTGVPQPPSEDRGTEFHDRIIYTEDEKISLSLELCAEGIPFKTPSTVHGHNGPENIKISDVRYLSCPAAFSVGNLKKFIRMKFDLKLKYEIDVFHTAEPLPDYYTLMDIAYIFTWTRRAPLRLYYTVFECKIPRKIPEPTIMEQNKTIEQEKVSMVEKQEQDNRVKSKNERNRKENKKRKLLDGPDDITPDFGDEKLKSVQEKRKEGGAQRKRAKKSTAVVVDSSVMEAMSESEEQLAKLTLNSSGDVRALCIDTGDESSMQSSCTETETQSVIANSNLCNGLQDEIDENDEDNVNKPKSQISPNSISLSLFQPLNATETNSNHTNSNRDTVFDFVHETSENKSSAPTKVRGKPGRKKLNKDTKNVNGAKVENTDSENKLVISGDGSEVSDGPQKKKPGRKKKAESVVNGSSESEAKPKVKKPVKINSETGERVKRKYVRKADKQKQSETDEHKTKLSETDKTKQSETVSKQTPKKGKKAQKEDTKNSSKTNCESTTDVNNEMCSNTNKFNKNSDLQVKQTTNNEGDGNKSNKVNKTSILSITEPTGATCDNRIVSVPDQTISTPLYGQTPKVTESNQGLPVAPSPPCAENSVSVLNGNTSCEPIFNTRSDASTKESSTVNRITVQQNGISDNGALSGTLKHANKGDYPTDMTNNSDDMDGKLVIDEGQCVDNGFHINGLEPGSDHFTNIEIPQLCPPQDMSHLGRGFNPTSPCPTGNSINNGYPPMDQVSDQPLDLTSSVRRDEYMKGKIFKTKMLKRTYMKQDMGLSQKDQKLGSPAKNGFHPHSWT